MSFIKKVKTIFRKQKLSM